MALKLTRRTAMSIYLQLPNIKGNVSAKNYQGWIECEAIEMGTNRCVITQPGRVHNRIRSLGTATEVTLVKLLDPSSPSLFEQFCVGKAMAEVKLDLCHSDSNPYMQFMFGDVLLSEYEVHVKSEYPYPVEQISLNFVGVEMRYTPYDAQHKPGSPISVRADVGSEPSFSAYLQRQTLGQTKKGLKLFVAVVYGEMAGVQSARETVWQGVGSVIMNRIHYGIWFKLRDSTAVIKQRFAFDAYTDPNKINWNNPNFYQAVLHQHQQFLKAWAILHPENKSMNKICSPTADEKEIVRRLTGIFHPISRGQVTTKANYYYTPSGPQLPEFLAHLDNPEQYYLPMSGVSPGDVKFYYIPAKIEREAGAKAKR
jgi:type VI secretion system secreted protein Hcp